MKKTILIPGLNYPSSPARTWKDTSTSLGEVSSPQVHSTNNLKRLLQILTGIPKIHILDLGRLTGPNIEWLIQRGVKVYVEDRISCLKPPPPPISLKGEKKYPPPEPLEPLDYHAKSFHAVLCWDLFDYIVVSQAQEFISQIVRILKPRGLLLAFFNFNRSSPAPPTRYRILREDQLEYETLPPNSIPRRIYENREIKDLFSELETLNSCFLKNQMREVLVQKRPEG